jgi:hypothetical protein
MYPPREEKAFVEVEYVAISRAVTGVAEEPPSR